MRALVGVAQGASRRLAAAKGAGVVCMRQAEFSEDGTLWRDPLTRGMPVAAGNARCFSRLEASDAAARSARQVRV